MGGWVDEWMSGWVFEWVNEWVFAKEIMGNYWEMVKYEVKIKNGNSSKEMLKDYISQYCQRYSTLIDGRITQLM